MYGHTIFDANLLIYWKSSNYQTTSLVKVAVVALTIQGVAKIIMIKNESHVNILQKIIRYPFDVQLILKTHFKL